MIFKGKKSDLKNERPTNEEKKFELVSCPLNGKYCTKVRSEMNRNYAEAMDFFKNKEFDKSIIALQNAYINTMELPVSSCSVCVDFYRSSIIESMENIHDDLKSMSTGIFKTNRYRSSYEKAQRTLAEYRDNAKKSQQLQKAV